MNILKFLLLILLLLVAPTLGLAQAGTTVIKDGASAAQASVKAAGTVTPNVIGVQGNASGVPMPVIVTTASGTTAYTGTGSTVTTLSATSGTVITANTIYIGQLSCYNITAGAITISRTDTEGTQFEVSYSIPANSNYLRSYALPEKMVGLKLWASAVSSITCTVTATQ